MKENGDFENALSKFEIAFTLNPTSALAKKEIINMKKIMELYQQMHAEADHPESNSTVHFNYQILENGLKEIQPEQKKACCIIF
jgi:hypothetical protein